MVVALGCVGATALADTSPKRELPDYDGRGNQDAVPGTWAIWIPRVLLSPVYAVNEFALEPVTGLFV